MIVGIQTPKFSYENNLTNVHAAVQQYGVKYPVLLDDNMATWNAYGNIGWPTCFLIDSQGHLRFSHHGMGDFSTMVSNIQELLAEKLAMTPPVGSYG